jgi:hypothetical protein
MSTELRADCARCCGLCCVGPAFDAHQGFGFNKPAHTPCINLGRDFRCAIHGERLRHGFPSCQAFDCYGAGQRVTQHLFAGKSWRTSPELATRMFDAYRTYRSLHELLAMLDTAIRRITTHDAPELRALYQHIDELCETGVAAIDTTTLRKRVLNHLQVFATGRSWSRSTIQSN